MADIGNDITRLIRRTPQQGTLKERNAASTIAAKRGSSRPTDKPQDATGSGGGGVPCQITGYGDTISDYKVSLYEDWPSTTPSQTNIDCKQLQIGGTMRIKSGAWAIAFQINSSWFMQIPVWIEKEPVP